MVFPSGIFYKPEEVSNELGVSEESLLRLAMAGKLVFSGWCPKILTTNGIYSGLWIQLLAEELLQANTWIMSSTAKKERPIGISCAMADDGQMLFFARKIIPNAEPVKYPIFVYYRHLFIRENEFERFKSSIIKLTDQPEKKDDLVVLEAESQELLVNETNEKIITQNGTAFDDRNKGGAPPGALREAVEFIFFACHENGEGGITETGNIELFWKRMRASIKESNPKFSDYVAERISSMKNDYVYTQDRVVSHGQRIEKKEKARKYNRNDVSKILSALRKKPPKKTS